jgi:hypothetical protein
MLTLEQAWLLVVKRESKGVADAIGDDGKAAGLGQMWWVFRKDYWPPWAWMVLAVADQIAFSNCVKRHPAAASVGLRHFYETVYNPHASAPELPDEQINLS